MRISGWSSDVCSSDLDGGLQPCRRLAAGRSAARGFDTLRKAGKVNAATDQARGVMGVLAGVGHQDRKSVVEGKSVSVCVDHGCRRIIKKQQVEENSILHTQIMYHHRNSKAYHY